MAKLDIGIFKGKKGRYNKLILQTLYDNGPLTAWQMAKKIYEPRKKGSKHSKEIEYYNVRNLHPVINRRLHDLASKEYLTKVSLGKWIFLFKGVITCLILQPQFKPWSNKWPEQVKHFLTFLPKPQGVNHESNGVKIFMSPKVLSNAQDKLFKDLIDLSKWVELSKTAKQLIEKGVINLDIINNRLLSMILIAQDETFSEQSFAEYYFQKGVES